MSLLKTITGVTSSGELTITKSTGTLVLQSSKNFAEYTNETVTLVIERSGASNVYLANKVPLKDFIYLLNCATKTHIQKGSSAGQTAMVDIGTDVAIRLGEGERIKLQFDNLQAADTLSVFYTEDFEDSLGVMKFEGKSILAGEKEKTFDTKDFCAVCVELDGLDEVGFTYMGGRERRFGTVELASLIAEEKPIMGYDKAGAPYESDSNYLVFPLDLITEITLYSDGSRTIQMNLVKVDELQPAATTQSKFLTLR